MKREPIYTISGRQLEQLTGCLRTIDQARNRLAAGRPENAGVCEELTRCSRSLYALANQVKTQKQIGDHASVSEQHQR